MKTTGQSVGRCVTIAQLIVPARSVELTLYFKKHFEFYLKGEIFPVAETS